VQESSESVGNGILSLREVVGIEFSCPPGVAGIRLSVLAQYFFFIGRFRP